MINMCWWFTHICCGQDQWTSHWTSQAHIENSHSKFGVFGADGANINSMMGKLSGLEASHPQFGHLGTVMHIGLGWHIDYHR